MTLYERQGEVAVLGWPSVLGYQRVGPISQVNVFGLRITRGGATFLIVTIGAQRAALS